MADAGEITDGTSASRRRRAGIWRWSQLVIAEVRNRHNNIIDTPAVNWLGNLTTTWQEIEQEPNILEFGLGPVP